MDQTNRKKRRSCCCRWGEVEGRSPGRSEKQKKAKVQIIFAASRLTELEVAENIIHNNSTSSAMMASRPTKRTFAPLKLNFHYTSSTSFITYFWLNQSAILSASMDSICRTECLRNLTGGSTFTTSWQPLHILGSPFYYYRKFLKLRLISYPRIQLPSIES